MTTLKTSTGNILTVPIGASCDILDGVFYDNAGVTIDKAALLTLTLRLEDPVGVVVNSWDGTVSILDANGGTVSTAGVLTMRLQPLDNVAYLSQSVTTNTAIFKYTWHDGVAVRTGIETRTINVQDVISSLLDSDGDNLIVDAGESMNYTATFLDLGGTQLTKAQLATLTGQLYDLSSGTSIRAALSVKDANDGTVDTAGELTWRLGVADSAMVGTETKEYHVIKNTWTYSDDTALTRTGISLRSFKVNAN